MTTAWNVRRTWLPAYRPLCCLFRQDNRKFHRACIGCAYLDSHLSCQTGGHFGRRRHALSSAQGDDVVFHTHVCSQAGLHNQTVVDHNFIVGRAL